MSIPPVSISHTCYLVRLNGTIHRVRRDGFCACGGTPQKPCAATPLVQTYLANGGQSPPGHDESTWPETWTTVPVQCPVCDSPTIADRHLNSRAGPGWRCTRDPIHYWLVRTHPMRRCLAQNPLGSPYPWYDTPRAERQAWLETHGHLPRLAPSSKEGRIHRALD